MEENIAFVKVKKEPITIVTIISTCDLITIFALISAM